MLHNIILKKVLLKLNYFNITCKQWVYFTVHSLVSIQGGVASNSEQLTVFRAPREGGLGPRKNADLVHAKKLHEKGTNRQINGHRDCMKESA